jgi:isoaspartyl peptidase/L-asparaginase-like protein (Ntn-hydrolase superfamily)
MFIAVHAGAGWHAPSTRSLLSNVMRHACQAAIDATIDNHDPTHAVIEAIRLVIHSQA